MTRVPELFSHQLFFFYVVAGCAFRNKLLRGRAHEVLGESNFYSFMKNHPFFKVFLVAPEAELRGILFE